MALDLQILFLRTGPKEIIIDVIKDLGIRMFTVSFIEGKFQKNKFCNTMECKAIIKNNAISEYFKIQNYCLFSEKSDY